MKFVVKAQELEEMLPTELKERKEKLSVALYEERHKVSPHYAQILARVREDCDRYYFKLVPQEFVIFCAFSFPLLDLETFYVATSLNVFLWETDDCLDHPLRNLTLKRYLVNSLYAALDCRLDPYSAYAEYLLCFFNKIRCIFLRDALRHEYILYLENVRKYMINNVDMDRVLMPEEYAEYRKVDSCCSFSFLLMFLDLNDFRPYKEFMETKTGSRIWSLAIENCVIINDVLSLKKDKKSGWKFNYVISWMKGYDYTEEEAVDKLLFKARECFDDLVATGERDLGEVGNDVVQRLILWISGHVVSTFHHPRYL